METFHEICAVSSFEIVAPYTLRIQFNDKHVQVVNLLPMLRGELYGPLQDLKLFNRVRLDAEAGTLVWPNEADFDPATLHDWDQVGDAMIAMARSWPDVMPKKRVRRSRPAASTPRTKKMKHSRKLVKASPRA